MNREDFSQNLDILLNHVKQTLLSKSADYSKSADVYNGMRQCERLGLVSTEKGMLVRALDKVGRLSNLIGNDQNPNNEPVLETILDLIGYSVLLYIYLDEKYTDMADIGLTGGPIMLTEDGDYIEDDGSPCEAPPY